MPRRRELPRSGFFLDEVVGAIGLLLRESCSIALASHALQRQFDGRDFEYLDYSLNQTPTIPELIAETISGLDTVLNASRKQQRRIRAAPNCRPFEPHGITHFHQTPELFLQIAGSGHLELADTTAPLQQDHLLVVPRGVAHNEYADTGPYRNIVIGLHANRVHFHVNIGDIPGLKPGQHRIRTSHVARHP